jgi:hyperosmotically inducible protein
LRYRNYSLIIADEYFEVNSGRFNMRYLLAMMIAAFLIVGCEKEGPAEKAGERVDEMAEDMGDAMDDASDSVKDTVEDAGDAMEDAADEMEEKLD